MRVLFLLTAASIWAICLLTGLPSMSLAETSDATESTYKSPMTVRGAAGVSAHSTNYVTRGTLGQPVVCGAATGSTLEVHDGFWSWAWLERAVVSAFNPRSFSTLLRQNFPNPFHGATAITYSLSRESMVSILVFDVQGRLIRTLENRKQLAGEYQVTWDGRDDTGVSRASGVYFYRMQVADYSSVKKMLLLK